jgi:hypothetical protein
MPKGSVHPGAPRGVVPSPGPGRQDDPAIPTDGRPRALLDEAVAYEAMAFDQDEPVDGGDLVEWFALWRVEARAVLGRPEEARRKAVSS